MGNHSVVAHDEWIKARRDFLIKEKEFTRLRDQLSQERRDLPWEAVAKPYGFEGPDGKRTLPELFEGSEPARRLPRHVPPGSASPDTSWTNDAACQHCSFWIDNFNGVLVHLNQRDVTLVAVSRAPYAKLAAYQKRMGWDFKWYSSNDTDFNFDYGVSFKPDEMAAKRAFYNYTMQDPYVSEREGCSVFYRDPGGVFHTYSTYARGIDMLNVAYHYLDLVPKGRDEGDRNQYWVRRHDEYGR